MCVNDRQKHNAEQKRKRERERSIFQPHNFSQVSVFAGHSIMGCLLYHLLSFNDRHAYLVVFKTAAPAAFVVVEVLGFGAVNAAALLAVATKKPERI